MNAKRVEESLARIDRMCDSLEDRGLRRRTKNIEEDFAEMKRMVHIVRGECKISSPYKATNQMPWHRCFGKLVGR